MPWIKLGFGLILAWVIFRLLLRVVSRSESKPVKYINSRGYVVLSHVNELEHRYIAKQMLGRDLEANEIVHHINGRKTDNDVRNLCLMDAEKHEFFHSWLKWKREKSGRYPSIGQQKKALTGEYNGTLLENVKYSKPANYLEQSQKALSGDKRKLGAQLYLLRANATCWKCKEQSAVVSVAIELRDVSIADDYPFFILKNITRMPESLNDLIGKLAPRYKLTRSRHSEIPYFMNHCEKCEAPFGDFYLHEEVGSPFSSVVEEEGASMKLMKIEFSIYYHVEISGDGEYKRSLEGFECDFHTNDLIWRFSNREA